MNNENEFNSNSNPTNMNPGINSTTGTTNMNSGINSTTGTTNMNSGINSTTGTTNTNSGINSTNSTTNTNPGINSTTGTTNMNPGINSTTGTTNTNPGINSTTGTTNMNPGINSTTGTTNMNSGINSTNSTTNTNPRINSTIGTTNTNLGINNTTGITNMNNDINKKQANKKLKMILFLILIILLIIIGIFVSKKIIKKDIDNKDYMDLTTTTSFFLENDDKYALFNIDGEQLTDFIFDSVGEFIKGTALVKKDDQQGVIKENGKMAIDFGKYEYIHSRAGLYEVKNEKGESYLINSQEKILYDLKNTYVDTPGVMNTHIVLENEEKFDVLNYKGNKIKSFAKVNDEEINDNFYTSEENGYVAVSFNNKVTLLNINTEKEILSFDAPQDFCVSDNSDFKNEVIILKTCSEIFKEEKNVIYKIVKDNTLYNLEDEWDNVSFMNKQIICRKDNKKYLLDSNYKKSIETENIIYKDEKNFIEKKTGSGVGNEVAIYNNGQEIKRLVCENFIYDVDEPLYTDLFPCYSNQSYEYYKLNGEKAFDKTFDSASLFDPNIRAVVKENDKKYLIDENGNQMGEKYDEITRYGKYYIVSINNLKGVIDTLGKVIFPCNYVAVDFKGESNIVLKTADSKYLFYNYEQNIEKELASFSKTPIFYNNYIEIRTDDKIQYFSITNGKLFYEKSL